MVVCSTINSDAHKARIRKVAQQRESRESRRGSLLCALEDVACDRKSTRFEREELRLLGRIGIEGEQKAAAWFEGAMNAVEEIREALLLQIHHEIETRDEVEFGLEVQIQCVHFDWVELVSHQSIAEICFSIRPKFVLSMSIA